MSTASPAAIHLSGASPNGILPGRYILFMLPYSGDTRKRLSNILKYMAKNRLQSTQTIDCRSLAKKDEIAAAALYTWYIIIERPVVCARFQ